MTWKKYFKPVNSVLPTQASGSNGYASSVNKYSSWLPEVYTGPADRLQRYQVYETMDFDHEVNAALDTIADFCTETDEVSQLPFVVKYNEEPTPAEITIIEKSLRQWSIINEFNKRLWKMFRSTLQYGDQILIRDPETYKLYWCDPNKIMKIIVNESEGKKIEVYYIKDIDLNLAECVATNQSTGHQSSMGTTSLVFGPPLTNNSGINGATFGNTSGSNAFGNQSEMPVDAAHVVQLSLSEGMDASWPFGTSVLEKVYKIYKQKELLEDSILIYRVHRAPERRVFFIDVGTMPPNKAQQYLERIRYEVQQKRIPSRNGGGGNVVDSTYNPMCLDLSTTIPWLDGRTLAMSELITEYRQGKENWVYSCDPVTGKVLPGNITWAGITKQNTKSIELKLDNGKSIICTPDHKIPVFGKGFVEAQHLTVDDALISFETKIIDGKNCVYDTQDQMWVEISYMVGEFFKSIDKYQSLIFDDRYEHSEKTTVVHRDFNVNNNSPTNIHWINHDDKAVMMQLLDVDRWVSLTTHEDKQLYLRELHNSLNEYKQHNPVVESVNNQLRVERKQQCPTRKIVSIQSVDNRDVGTITVDFEENWHNHHTFAVGAGIFVKNSMLEDYFFATTSDGRGSKVETLPGGENLGSIDDLKYFNNKMIRALGVPSSYLPTGPDDGTSAVSDGRLGSAFIQEFRFSKVCERYQKQLIKPLDKEFKLFLKKRGVTIDNSMFSIEFTPPQSFSEYRQLELDAAKINVFSSMSSIPYVSKRYALKRYLGWSEEELAENEKMWKEEKGQRKVAKDEVGQASLSNAGITPSGVEGMAPEGGFEDSDEADMGELEDTPQGVSDEDVDSFGEEDK